MDNWDEIRTAYQVARMGTVSGAAGVLGVHHATVIRHIDALEDQLGVKLFQRHARGYTPTEAGQDLLRVAQGADDQFSQLAGRIKGRGQDVSGELVITSLSALVPLLVPILSEFQRLYPDVVVRLLTGNRLFRLEYGEAHVAIRAGSAPQDPDNVVQPMLHQKIGLYAARSYVKRMGMPAGDADFAKHLFVGSDSRDTRAPFYRWMWEVIPEDNVVFRTSDIHAVEEAILQGIGIGFMSQWQAAQNPDLVEVAAPRDEWASSLWLVTHMALHRTSKVQALLNFLKDSTKDWE